MAIYEYKGQQYDIATDDHAVAKAKILKYLGEQEAPKPAPAAEAPAAPTPYFGDAMGAGVVDAMTNIPPARKSVLEGQKMPVEEAVRVGVRPEFINAVQAQLDAMPADKRAAALANMSQRGDVYGRAARTIAERYGKLEQITSPTLTKVSDRRLEAGTQQFIEQGMEPEAAKAMAWAQATEGAPTPTLQQARPDVVGEQAAQEAAARAKELENAGFLERVGAETRSRATQTGLGLINMYADLTGDDEMAARARSATRIEGARGAAIPKGESLFERSAQGAISSLATQGPILVLSAMTGTPAVALAQAGIDVFGSEYAQGRSQGLSPGEASLRAGLLAMAEITFERFGLGESIKAIRGALTHMPTDKIADYLAKAFAKELPAEQFTSATQFLIDKAPTIGLNRNAGWKDFWENQAETLRQTILQTGAQSAGVVGTSKGLSYIASKLPERPEPYTRDELQGLAYEMAARNKGFLVSPKTTEKAAPPGAPEAPPSATPVAPPTAELDTTQIQTLAADLEAKGYTPANARRIATARVRRATAETQAPVAAAPAEDPRISERAQEYIDTGMPKEEALKVATAEIQEEDKADALAEAEARGDQNVARPVSAPGGEGVSVAGQPSAVTPTGGVGVAEPSGVVPAGQDVAGAEAGTAAQPEAVGLYDRLGMPQGPAKENARNEELSIDDAKLLKRMIVKTVEDGLAAGKTRQQIAAQLEALTKGGITNLDFERIHNYMTERGVKEEEAPARPRGRPRLSEEQKASAEAARKQQRIAANQASRNVDKAEALLQKSSEPLDPDNFETDEEFAEAEKEQRLNRAAALRTLYQISRENKNKPGQRAAEILKGLNPREVADAKAGYEYQKSKQAAEQVSRSGQGAKGVEPVNPALTKVTNGAQAITQILKTGTGFQKMLAKRIRSFVGNVKIVVIEQGQELPEQLQRPKNLASWERSRGLYIENTKTKTRTVYLRGESFGDDQGVNTVTVLHELLHAAVNLKLGQALLAAQRGYSQNTQLAKAYGDLLRTMNSARILFNDMAREGRLPKHFSDLARAGNIFDDPREFVAYGMTDPEFQQILRKAAGYEEDTSYFTQFVDAIRRMLGMDEDSVNALSDLIVVTDKVLSAQLPADMRLVAYGMPGMESSKSALQRRGPLFHLDTYLGNDRGEYGADLRNPVTLKDGTRLDGFTDRAQTTFTGYDKNQNRISIHRDSVNPEDIVYSRDSNRTAEALRKALQADAEQVSAQAKKPKDTGTAAGAKRAWERTQEIFAKSSASTKYSSRGIMQRIKGMKDPQAVMESVRSFWPLATQAQREVMARIPSMPFLGDWAEDAGLPHVRQASELMTSMLGAEQTLAENTEQLIYMLKKAFKADPKLQDKLTELIYRTTGAEVDPSDPNAKIRVPEADAMYAALGPVGQDLYKRAKDHYEERGDLFLQLLEDNIDLMDIDPKVKSNLITVLRKNYEAGQRISPYFPFVRDYGPYWLSVGKGDNKEFYIYDSLRKRDADKRRIMKERGIPAEDMLDGNNIDSLRRQVYESSSLIRETFDAIDTVPMHSADTEESHAAYKEALKDAVYQGYLNVMPERSFRSMFKHRKGLAGYRTDLIQNIATVDSKMNKQLARLEYAQQLRNTVDAAQEAIKERSSLQPFVSELRRRVDAVLSPERQNAWDVVAGIAGRVGFTYLLAGPSLPLLQPLALATSGVSVLWGNYRTNPATAAAELLNAFANIPNYGITTKLPDGDVRYQWPSMVNSNKLTGDEARAMKDFGRSGMHESTLARDIWNYADNPTSSYVKEPGKEAEYYAAKTMRGLDTVVGTPFHVIERWVREAMFFAGYRLGRKDGLSHEEAVAKSLASMKEAVGDYSTGAKPRFMQRGLGKMMFALKTFAILITQQTIGNLLRAIPFLNKEGKIAAIKKFSGIMLTTGLLAGASGAPLASIFFSTAAGIVLALQKPGDDDNESEDEAELRETDPGMWFRHVWLPKNIPDVQIAGVDLYDWIDRGVINAMTGLDVASRIQLSTVWGQDVAKPAKNALEAATNLAVDFAGGAYLSLVKQWFNALDAYSLGDKQKAAEMASPKPIRDWLKAERYEEEGVKQAGKEVLPPGALTALELWGQRLGFAPDIVNILQKEGIKTLSVAEAIQIERNRILKKLDNAISKETDEGDAEYERILDTDVEEFNRKYPNSELKQREIDASLKARERIRDNAVAGVSISKQQTEALAPLLDRMERRVEQRVKQREKEVSAREARKKD